MHIQNILAGDIITVEDSKKPLKLQHRRDVKAEIFVAVIEAVHLCV
jgi:hypothetical protein